MSVLNDDDLCHCGTKHEFAVEAVNHHLALMEKGYCPMTILYLGVAALYQAQLFLSTVMIEDLGSAPQFMIQESTDNVANMFLEEFSSERTRAVMANLQASYEERLAKQERPH